MLRVGLTGGLASGKSFAASEFERLGCAVLQADKLGHRILAEDLEARDEIVREFGQGILSEDGAISRKALSAIVFSDKTRLQRLNAIVHPRVFAGLERFFGEVETRDPDAVAMVEAAIMIESGSYKRYQRLVLAACPRELQIERFMRRDAASRQEAESRIARQMPLEDKRRFAHFLIDTGGTEAETLRQVRTVYGRLRAEAAQAGRKEVR
jgi:dephospho-CoA kinase